VIVGVRPEDIQDAALASDAPADRRLRGRVLLTEALGSEIVVHLSVDAPPASAQEVEELATDAGGLPARRRHGDGYGCVGRRPSSDQSTATPSGCLP